MSRKSAITVCMFLAFAVGCAIGRDASGGPWVSPDRKTEVYEIQTKPYVRTSEKKEYETYAVLLIKFAESSDYGACISRGKFFDVYWSPDSKYLAVFTSYLTHNTDLDLFRVDRRDTETLSLSLIYSLKAEQFPPVRQWTNWSFLKWDMKKNSLWIEENHDLHSDKRPDRKLALDLNSRSLQTISYSNINHPPFNSIRESFNFIEDDE